MKKTFTLLLSLAVIILAGCSKDQNESDGAQGYLLLKVSKGAENLTVKATDGDVDIDSFIMTISSASTSYKYTVGEFNSTFENGVIYLNEGDYTVTVTSPDTEDVEWEQPIYGCSKDFTIKSDVLTLIELVCTIQNMKVTVLTTEEFQAEFVDYNIVVTGEYNGNDKSLTWTKDIIEAGTAGYFAVSDLTVSIRGIRADGSSATATQTITGNAAADHHIITIGISEPGSAGFSITIDDSLNDRNTSIDLPGGSNPGDGGTAPTIVWASNPNFDPMYLAEEMDVVLVVSAPEGIKSFIVDIDSATLTELLSSLGLSNPLDLINSMMARLILGTFGVPVGSDLSNQTLVDFDLSGLVPMIYSLTPEAGSYHIFTLEISDNEDQSVEQALTFIMPE